MIHPAGYELDRMVFRLKKDPAFRDKFLFDFELACSEFKLTKEEKRSLKDRDYKRLAELGLKPELVMALANIC
jgi:hypothetical protein